MPTSRRARAGTTTRTSRASRSPTDDFSRRDIEFHRETAAAYDDEVTTEFAVYHERLLEPFLDQVAESRPGGRALDLGCGTGVVCLALARRGFEVIGVDHSPEMLEIARRKLVGMPVTLETGDVRSLRFPDGQFDCVTIQGLLHHLEDFGPCVREADRVLRPGGFLYISEPTRDPTAVKRALKRVWALLPRRRRGGPEHDVPTVEEPISSAELRRVLDELEVGYALEFLTHVPPLRRRLPDWAYLAVTRALSFPWRRRKGDLVFVFGQKRG